MKKVEQRSIFSTKGGLPCVKFALNTWWHFNQEPSEANQEISTEAMLGSLHSLPKREREREIRRGIESEN